MFHLPGEGGVLQTADGQILTNEEGNPITSNLRPVRRFISKLSIILANFHIVNLMIVLMKILIA